MAALELRIQLLDRRYHGAGDWPPDPARVFQALVHGGHTGARSGSWTAEHEAALVWLCSLPAPEIACRRTHRGQAYRLFVPNNSLDRNRRNTKTDKCVAPALLASGDGRPDLVYRWSAPDDEARRHLPALDELASRLLVLGWGVDIAAAVATLDETPAPSGYELLTPTRRGGRAMRTLGPGLLGHLRQRHEAARTRVTAEGVDPYTRATEFPLTRYRQASESAPRPCCAFGLQRLDGEPFSLDWRRTQDVAAWLRHMAGEAMREEFGPNEQAWIDSYVMGHTAAHELGARLSYLPLPSIGHPHSDGAIRRALIVGPPGAVGRDAEAVQLLRIKAPGRVLTRDGDRQPEAVPVPALRADRMLRRYCAEARSWRSVTPVILPGHNARGKSISVAKTEKLLFQSLDAAGYPVEAVERLSFQAAPYWAGCAAAAAIKTPRHLNRWPRLHASIEFRHPVEGPLAIGLGRHCGIGLFAAIEA